MKRVCRIYTLFLNRSSNIPSVFRERRGRFSQFRWNVRKHRKRVFGRAIFEIAKPAYRWKTRQSTIFANTRPVIKKIRRANIKRARPRNPRGIGTASKMEACRHASPRLRGKKLLQIVIDVTELETRAECTRGNSLPIRERHQRGYS